MHSGVISEVGALITMFTQRLSVEDINPLLLNYFCIIVVTRRFDEEIIILCDFEKL
ncbi:predicted protein [Sclerotinia sclerotiorum 1980 UF-70]|uniref:Uncharacterized protein n=1 Tax=Sclerotinia sclerotiorum (strain ATCC 18683 / 1980 / Ss-1) TaxID=665079 RepID=A7EAK1_SCLS1|nr:predicted protein [Sclerotinia sclerotiorum 1980 UF-70]EDN99479.1 predicted protein [Sclerotinia sclerotiorum 1980 UF-70]